MGKAKKASDRKAESNSRKLGRRLTLTLSGKDEPHLFEIAFQFDGKSDPSSCHFETTKHFAHKLADVLAVFFLEYLDHSARKPPEKFRFSGALNGSLAATLDGARGQPKGMIHDLFVEKHGKQVTPCLKRLFDGKKVGIGEKGKRYIWLDVDFLPPDCIEVSWDGCDENPIVNPSIIKLLAGSVRSSLEGGNDPKALAEDVQEVSSTTEEPTLQAKDPQTEVLGEFSDSTDELPPAPRKDKLEAATSRKSTFGNANEIFERETEEPDENTPIIHQIDPKLFEVISPGALWPDDRPLLEFGDGDSSFKWTLKNAFESVLVMGATGSGKSSGSGVTIAEALLRAGVGGLILTVKKDEAERWRKLCAYCGREEDFVAVRRRGPWKLNLLAYEAQRPGEGGGLADNMVSFSRNLLAISARNRGTDHDDIWLRAGDQLLAATFELFLSARAPITFDSLAEFIAAAPVIPPRNEAAWKQIPVFGEVMKQAEALATSKEDLRLFRQATDYWFKVYAKLAPETRTSITLGVFAMLDAFRGRDIPDLISSDTNITPEKILSEGKIVVVDLPVKEFGHTGLLVQSAWKYLFQTALERHVGANNSQRRPMLLWEDEAQHFCSEHDEHFQATARSSRACHVLLSQNLHSFYNEFGPGGRDAAHSIFGNLNTKIFHANTDIDTNKWASELFGTEIVARQSFSVSPEPQSRGFWDSLRQFLYPADRTTGGFSDQREAAVQPQEFCYLRTGGKENDFKVDAYITWIASGRRSHFTKVTFSQNPNL